MYILIGVLFYLHYIRLFVFLSYELCICLFRDSFIDLLIYLNLWWEFWGSFCTKIIVKSLIFQDF